MIIIPLVLENSCIDFKNIIRFHAGKPWLLDCNVACSSEPCRMSINGQRLSLTYAHLLISRIWWHMGQGQQKWALNLQVLANFWRSATDDIPWFDSCTRKRKSLEIFPFSAAYLKRPATIPKVRSRRLWPDYPGDVIVEISGICLSQIIIAFWWTLSSAFCCSALASIPSSTSSSEVRQTVQYPK